MTTLSSQQTSCYSDLPSSALPFLLSPLLRPGLLQLVFCPQDSRSELAAGDFKQRVARLFSTHRTLVFSRLSFFVLSLVINQDFVH